MAVIQQRPDWLPEGHAFCPGLREKVGIRQFQGMPGVTQNIFQCEHGSFNNLADAWTAHDQFKPTIESARHGTLVIEASVEDEIIALERAIAYLNVHLERLKRYV